MTLLDPLSYPAPWDEVVVNILTLLFLVILIGTPVLFLYLPIKWVEKNKKMLEGFYQQKIYKPINKIPTIILNTQIFWITSGPKATFILGYITYYLSEWLEIPLKQYNYNYLAHPVHNKLRKIMYTLYKVIVLIKFKTTKIKYDDTNLKYITAHIWHRKNQKRKIVMLEELMVYLESDYHVIFSKVDEKYFKIIFVSEE
ncbi:MAG: hypothetical protein OEX81_03415 [Candidatus Pacebacteria bacterium]|nr:hypothetical protein [Candidatus Paceibacterota bacterium]